MQVYLKTHVAQNYRSVFNAFDEQLFLKLAPPYPRLTLSRFDGSAPGDLVEVEMKTGFSSHRWTSLITESRITESEAYFIDEGQELPFPLKHWQHKHLITRESNGSVIHDIIDYSTDNGLLDMALYPLVVAQFSMRKPIYRKIFS